MKKVKRIPTICFHCQSIWNILRVLLGDLSLICNSSSQHMPLSLGVLGRNSRGPDSFWSKITIEEWKVVTGWLAGQTAPFSINSWWPLAVICLSEKQDKTDKLQGKANTNIPHGKIKLMEHLKSSELGKVPKILRQQSQHHEERISKHWVRRVGTK